MWLGENAGHSGKWKTAPQQGGVVEARRAWILGGRRDMLRKNYNAYNHVFDVEFFPETYKMIAHGDWSGSFLGGYQVEFRTIEDRADSTLVEITVYNRTGWGSGSRIPFSGESRRPDEQRGAFGSSGYGGNLDQWYKWVEIINK